MKLKVGGVILPARLGGSLRDERARGLPVTRRDVG
jgi:hypothetical protein